MVPVFLAKEQKPKPKPKTQKAKQNNNKKSQLKTKPLHKLQDLSLPLVFKVFYY
jgi:hypothetical protein